MEKRNVGEMEINRKPFQGVMNIIRFNWHFYVVAFVVLICLVIIGSFLPSTLQTIINIMIILSTASVIISLAVSYYIYDLSGLYKLRWIQTDKHQSLLNINAGFDETSELIKQKCPYSELSICDFYNPRLHTEVSIKRAREAYPPYPGTISAETNYLPFQDETFDQIFAILAAHEIRDKQERILFFKQLHRILKPHGQIFITEHLRDLNNFWVYNIGFMHFHSRKTWLHTFKKAGFIIKGEQKSTPFITTFILEVNGNSL
ncbi:methyltransferase domain-containing protein [Elizabethkingia miricola]